MTKKKNTLSITEQDFLDIAGVMFVVLDTNARVVIINKKGCEILGYKKDEILGKDWFSHFFPKESRDEVRSVFYKLIKGDLKPPEFYTNPVVTKNGEQRHLSFHNNILRNREGNIVGTLSSGEDITERKKTEETLSYSE
jgi:PAS domain S-box-containing protein